MHTKSVHYYCFIPDPLGTSPPRSVFDKLNFQMAAMTLRVSSRCLILILISRIILTITSTRTNIGRFRVIDIIFYLNGELLRKNRRPLLFPLLAA